VYGEQLLEIRYFDKGGIRTYTVPIARQEEYLLPLYAQGMPAEREKATMWSMSCDCQIVGEISLRTTEGKRYISLTADGYKWDFHYDCRYIFQSPRLDELLTHDSAMATRSQIVPAAIRPALNKQQ
jgi:hypothetical protein